MHPPLVSVCIPTYNHERYIRQCLESALMQSADVSLEVLIGDDGSTDGTQHIARYFRERYPDIIHYHRHTTKKGAGGNLEYLARTARGKYIAHLDGDDFWLPQKLRSQITFLEANEDAPAAYTNAFCILDSGLPLGVFSNFSGQRINATDLVRRGNFLHHSSLIYRASFLEDLFYRGSPLLDYNFHLSLSRHGALAYLPTPFTVYRVSSSTSILVHSNDYVRELYWKTLSDTAKPLVTPADLSAGMAEFMRSVFFRSIRLRSFHLIANWWPRILRNAPLGKTKLLAQAGWSIFRVGMREAITSLCTRIVGNKTKILYPQ